jgi:hypothetical protein
MKVALCLSGQARFLETCFYESMKPNIIDNLNPDVFIHTWDVSDRIGQHFLNGNGFTMGEKIPSNLMETMLNLYQPKQHVIEPQKLFESNKWSSRLMPSIKSDHLYSMFYSIHESNKLKKQYEYKNNFTYDWVIRIRFDMAIPSGPLNLSKLDNNYLWVATGCFDNINGYLDSLGYSNSQIMDTYSDTFNYVDYIADNNPNMGICGEYVLRKHLDKNNISVMEIGTHNAYR